MMIPPPDCSLREDHPCVDVPSYQDEYRGGYEPDWEEDSEWYGYDLSGDLRGYSTEDLKREKEQIDRLFLNSTGTDSQLRALHKRSRNGDWAIEVGMRDNGYYDYEPSRRLTPRQIQKSRRKRNRILTKRGCMSAPSHKGHEDVSFSTAAAAA
jgi:hypothetical protein